MKKREFLFIISSIILVFGLIYSHFSGVENQIPLANTEKGSILEVHFQDVSNADSVFIKLPDGKTLLIDGGEKENGKGIIDYIKKFSTERIDYVVATHPHSDHIGGLPQIIDSFEIGEFFMPNAVHTTSIFEDMLNSLEKSNVKVTEAKQGVTLFEGENYRAECLSPSKDEYDNLNNFSAVIKLTYGNKSFLFTGDAEKQIERELVQKYGSDLKADVLKVSHHGSNTSSTSSFLKKVNPEIAVISSGNCNDYGHPHKEVIDRLESLNVKILRTDKQGTIVLKTDGAEWSE